jgi:hypothetical protein
MNLTKLFVASLCFTAMTASAASYLGATNDFEDATLKGTWSGGVTALNITNGVEGVVGITDDNTPIVGVGDTRVLKLDTQGAVWTNTVNESFLAGDLYADMLVKFVRSEDLPVLPTGSGKLALAIKANTGGTNMLNVANNNGSTFTWAETAQEISTTEWYRVTVKLTTVPNIGTYAQVYINNTAVGTLLDLDGQSTDLEAIGFQGTGYIDELAVRRDNPFPIGSVDLTLSFSTGIASVYVGGIAKTNGEVVVASAAGTNLVITTANFYEIASVTGASITGWPAGGLTQTNGTVTVTSTTNTTVTITAQAETDATPYAGSGSFTNYPASDVATWAIAKGVTALTEGIYDNYLLNISTNSLPQLLIKSVAVTNSIVTVTVEAAGVDFSDINGTLKLMVSPVLGGTSSNITAAVSGTTTATVSTDIGTNKFVKALIE